MSGSSKSQGSSEQRDFKNALSKQKDKTATAPTWSGIRSTLGLTMNTAMVKTTAIVLSRIGDVEHTVAVGEITVKLA